MTGEVRLLLLSREYPPETGGGGIGSYVETMARALAARGHQVHVLSCVEGQAREDREVDGVHLHRRGVRRLLPKLRRRLPALASRLEGAVSCYLESRRLPPADVVEAPDWRGEGLVFALRRSRPLVVHLHTPLLLVGRHNPDSFRWSRDGRMAARLERLAVRRADLVTSPSNLLARDLAAEGWLRGRETRIVRYPVDLETWASLPSPGSSPPRLLVVGRLEARKAPEVVVRAASLLTDVADLEVVFIGTSALRNGASYRDWLVGLAGDLGVLCSFVDYVPRDELPAWYGSARVVVLASRYDNFPFAALEAMASARPVVCTRATGTAELIEGTDAGAVVEVDDAEGMAEALRPYVVDSEAAVRAGRSGRRLVERLCSPERIAEEREACYREAITRWGRRRRRGDAATNA